MKYAIRFIAVVLYANCAVGGINWKAIWFEAPGNPIFLKPGTVQAYKVMGLNGADVIAELTRSPYLRVISFDPDVLEIDKANAQLIGRSSGQTEIRLSFSEATSIVKVYVRSQEPHQ